MWCSIGKVQAIGISRNFADEGFLHARSDLDYVDADVKKYGVRLKVYKVVDPDEAGYFSW